ncbi:hypothetical protein [Thalassomonas sp. M1454]|uniref:hypothetical protein n=1 Tax=Thalassomonas sp. M1454 TaxID=2594477 RepID=UPI00117CA371|nr:hypothetical protein [Thalassomonas sp. M1454]TRX57207.1 hypothetical protein FNN08_06825 [Thalassomonas sp. M1454]
MNKLNYIVLLSAFGLTACGGESSKTPEVEETPVVEAPIVEESPVIEAPTTQEPAAETPKESPVSETDIVAPKGIKITATPDAISLDWDVVPNATSYQIYHNEGEDVSIANGMVYYTTLSEFNHENLSGDIHSYRVQAVIDDSESELSMLATADLSAIENVVSDSNSEQ